MLPLRGIDVDDVGVPHDQQRPLAAVAREARDDVGPLLFEREHLHRYALALEDFRKIVGGGLFVAA